MARDFYLIRFDDHEAVTYTDFEQALEAFECGGNGRSVLLISGDGIWRDETMDFEHELSSKDPEGPECYRADMANKMALEAAE